MSQVFEDIMQGLIEAVAYTRENKKGSAVHEPISPEVEKPRANQAATTLTPTPFKKR